MNLNTGDILNVKCEVWTVMNETIVAGSRFLIVGLIYDVDATKKFKVVELTLLPIGEHEQRLIKLRVYRTFINMYIEKCSL